jgi:hypothetical protein
MTYAKANKTFRVQASLIIVANNRENIFIVQTSGLYFKRFTIVNLKL